MAALETPSTCAETAYPHQLSKIASAATRWCERKKPHLLSLLDLRSQTLSALRVAARATGSRTLCSAERRLPDTIQIDDRGTYEPPPIVPDQSSRCMPLSA